jgi:hypothetical protein
MPSVEQLELLAAVKAHTFELDIERVVSSEARRAALERRIEDTVRLLEWLSPILEAGRLACPAPQTPPRSNARIGRDRSLNAALDPSAALLSEQDRAPR